MGGKEKRVFPFCPASGSSPDPSQDLPGLLLQGTERACVYSGILSWWSEPFSVHNNQCCICTADPRHALITWMNFATGESCRVRNAAVSLTHYSDLGLLPRPANALLSPPPPTNLNKQSLGKPAQLSWVQCHTFPFEKKSPSWWKTEEGMLAIAP